MRSALLLAALPLAACGGRVDATDDDELVARAKALHADAIVLDTHSDTTQRLVSGMRFAERHDDGHMDLPRIREGGLDAVFLAVWMGRTEGEGRAVRKAVDQLDAIHAAIEASPGDLVLATTSGQVRAAADAGQVAVLIGIEGGHIIEEDLAALRVFHRLGARYMSLTHSFHTTWADSAGTDRPLDPLHGGLTDLGRDVVREMNRLGMMIDVSHVSDDTFWDAIEASRAPILASHSSARVVADHARNMTDDMLRAVAEGGGVVQINFYPWYIDPEKVAVAAELRPRVAAIYEEYADDPGRAREERIALFRERDPGPTEASVVIDHFEHVLAVIGPDHVGIGADWDGVPELPVGLEDCSTLERITIELLRRGHSEETVRKVLGENLLRVLDEVDRVGRELRGEGGER